MNQQELIADLRNKLGPIKNYIALQKEIKQVREENAAGSFQTYLTEMKLDVLEKAIGIETQAISANMIAIEEIFKQMEKLN